MHSFVVPAYGHSEHLEQCLTSLAGQTTHSRVVISTSTPFEGLLELAQRHGATVHVHGPNQGIAHDWAAAVACAGTEWVTIAHQDDVYLPRFVERTLSALRGAPQAALAFTGYEELGGGIVRPRSAVLWIKLLLLELAFLGRTEISSEWSKTNALRFGCPIPCPSVTLRRSAADSLFDPSFSINLDWSAWLKLASHPDSNFVYIRETLMQHRIHPHSATSDGIAGGARAREDERMFRRIWPASLIPAITALYRIAYKSNAL